MSDFSFKRVGVAVKNNFSINKSIPVLLIIIFAISIFCTLLIPLSSIEDGFVNRAVNPELNSYYLQSIKDWWEMIVGVGGVQCIVGVVMAIISAVVSIISITARWRDKKSADFWSSQSTSRREFVLADVITSVIWFLVAMVPTWYLSLVMAHAFTTTAPIGLFEVLLCQTPVLLFLILFYLSVMTTAYLAFTLAGSVLSGLVFFGTILGYPALVWAFTSMVSSTAFHTELVSIIEHDYAFFAYSSPVLRYFFSLSATYPLGAVDYLLFALWTAAMALILYLIVNKRPAEHLQESVVFPILRYPLQHLWMFFATLFCSWFFYMLTSSPLWFAMGAIIGILVSFIGMNMIFQRSANAIFKNASHLLISGGVFVAVCLVFVADVFSIYKEPKPEFDKIYDFSVYMHTQEYEEDCEHNTHWEVSFEPSQNEPEVDGKDRKLLLELWNIIEEADEREPLNANAKKYHVSMTFWCEGDPSSWRNSTNYLISNPRALQIIEELGAKFELHHTSDTYYYEEDTTVNAVPDISSSVGIIGGADGPTEIVIQ